MGSVPLDVRMTGFSRRATLAEVEDLIRGRVTQIEDERVPSRLAAGRILAEDVRAARDMPPHRKSAMDGYAVRAADLPGTLEVVGEVMAAGIYPRELRQNEAVRIMTGGRIPDGADTVVMVEQVRLLGSQIGVELHRTGTHVLCRGEDVAAGSIVLPKGRRLRPQDLALLAAIDVLEVRVVRRPRVRIIPTGNELVRPGTPIPSDGGAVVESSSFMLEALARRDGADPGLYPIVRDDEARIRAALLDPGADVVVVTGGSSVGKEDLAPVVLRAIGELAVHGVDVRPASPTGIGFIGSTAVVLAPGYPVASLVAWDLFARPIVQQMAGAPVRLPYRREKARLSTAVDKPQSRVELPRAEISPEPPDGFTARPLRGGAALLSTSTKADGFVWLPAGRARFEQGELVDAYLYDS